MLFRPSLPCLKSSPSSRTWLARQFRDPYVRDRLSDPAAYRSRSSFKLLEIDQKYGLFLSQPHVKSVVDLGAAPGGWSQVVAGKLGWTDEGSYFDTQKKSTNLNEDSVDDSWSWSDKTQAVEDDESPRLPRRWLRKAERSVKAKSQRSFDEELDHYDPLNIDDTTSEGRGTIIAVDILNMQPIRGVHNLRVDFLSSEAETLIKGLLSIKGDPEGKVDVILSDMAANMSGNSVRDTESSLEICQAVFQFASRNLRSAESIGKRRGGVLLLKHFMHPLLQRFRADILEPNFNDVKFIKPDASRSQSSEGYWLCQGWRGQSETAR